MPKRSLDATGDSPTMPKTEKTEQAMRPVPKKTERSHAENQERAYIAASRRTDRSLEARVKSAQMASEIHKRRTGKALKVSEKIVQAEEMYEEEEDDMPRAYQQLLAANMQTGSAEFNNRVNAFLANKIAMASIVNHMHNENWLQNPINQAFAKEFPNANRQAQSISHRFSNSAYYTPLSTGQGAPQPGDTSTTSPVAPNFGSVDYQQQPINHRRRSSQYRHMSVDMSPIQRAPSAALSPGMSPTTPQPMSPGMSPGMPHPLSQPMSPALAQHMPQQHSPAQAQFTEFPTDPFLYANSAFTAELPPEAKMLAAPGLNMNDPLAHILMGYDTNVTSYYSPSENSTTTLKTEPRYEESFGEQPSPYDYSPEQLHFDQGFGPVEGQDSNANTPALGAQNENWDNYVDWNELAETAPEQQMRG